MLLNFSIFLAVVVVALGLQKKVTWENAVELGGGYVSYRYMSLVMTSRRRLFLFISCCLPKEKGRCIRSGRGCGWLAGTIKIGESIRQVAIAESYSYH